MSQEEDIEFINYKALSLVEFLTNPKYGAELLTRLLSKEEETPKSAMRKFDILIRGVITEHKIVTSIKNNLSQEKGGS